jgi:pimeloyl-ACP methyl ester carboxylesterase
MGPEPAAQRESDEPRAAPKIAERGVVVAGVRIATAMSDASRELLAHAPLVVLPAAGHSWMDYRPILERFATERRVFALDWPGFGASDKPAPAKFEYSSAHFAELFTGWLDSLGIARAVLLGNSVGAAAAVRYAAAKPQRVAGLALVAPGGFTPLGVTLAVSSRLLGTPALLRRIEPAFTSLYLGPDSPQTLAIVAAHRGLRTKPEYGAYIQAYAALWRSFARPSDQLANIAGQVTAPALVIRGALDPVITAADAQRATAAVGPRGALQVVLPGAGHLPFLQQPERFFQAVAGLLATAELRAIEQR